MNKSHFELLMGAVDNDLLEEAQRPPKRSRVWIRTVGTLAACLCLATVGYFVLRPDTPSVQIANPIHKVTADEVMQLGYSLPLPEGAQSVSYTLVDQGADRTPMAQATFLQNGKSYTCRALKTEQPQDISGIYAAWSESLDWTIGSLEMQLRQSDDTTAWVGWFASDSGTQWCLTGKESARSLLHTAQSIVETLGYNLTVAPAEAEDVLYNAFALDDLTVGETTFCLAGIRYSYRMASTSQINENFADISGTDTTYQNSTTTEIAWCTARISYDDNGAGKIIWFDVVPGLLYSLSMDHGASESALINMATRLFSPAQDSLS